MTVDECMSNEQNIYVTQRTIIRFRLGAQFGRDLFKIFEKGKNKLNPLVWLLNPRQKWLESIRKFL